MKSKLRVLPLLAVLFAGCQTPDVAAPPPVTSPVSEVVEAQPTKPPEPIRLTLVGTNDLHGWILPKSAPLKDATVLEEGGLPAFAGYVKILREDNPGGVLLLDAGDIFQGTLLSNLTEGEVVISAMNHLGYTAAALGNHEFDYGPQGPMPVATEPGMDPFGALKARVLQAKFPILASNLYEAATGERPEWMRNRGFVIVEARGLKVALVGLITPTTPSVTNPVNVTTLRFGGLLSESEDAAREARAQGAEVVVGIAHAGGKCETYTTPTDLSSCDPAQEIFELLMSAKRGTFDAVIAGHTHALLGHVVNGTPVIETGGMGKAFGIVELFVDPRSRKVLPERTVIKPGIAICEQVEASLGSCDLKKAKEVASPEVIPATFLGRTIERDRAIDAIAAPALAAVEALQRKPLGFQNPQHLGRKYEAESGLGSLLADALRELMGADVALLNSGGLRADLRAGPVRYGDFYEVIPFDNTIATVVVTGDELRRLLLAAYGARKGVFQQSGLKLAVGQCPGQGRLKSVTLADGTPLSPDRRYRVVMPDFLARGGDGLAPVVGSLPPGRIDFGESRALGFRDALVTHFQNRGKPLKPPAVGRISVIREPKGCRAGEGVDLHAAQ